MTISIPQLALCFYSNQYFLFESSLFCRAVSGLNWLLYFRVSLILSSSFSLSVFFLLLSPYKRISVFSLSFLSLSNRSTLSLSIIAFFSVCLFISSSASTPSDSLSSLTFFFFFLFFLSFFRRFLDLSRSSSFELLLLLLFRLCFLFFTLVFETSSVLSEVILLTPSQPRYFLRLLNGSRKFFWAEIFDDEPWLVPASSVSWIAFCRSIGILSHLK